ncbi:transcriptional regulator, AraC family [Chitinophaga sp. CF118]|uniref:helix-turn-helix transcriptional regulator n=1 Tax=Chitinophaga sp. CF118 TaxID=1884367 RepID=UPI0008E9CDA6|nr:helix-turn-helix transcriptional regulator [Chitinophaga sp. CF118]SFD47583.1 transcriptional regulator, AraC family [Chitinophaga sp. CF118]
MKIERYLPADNLKPFIKAFMIIESDNGMENNTLPDTSVVMAFRYMGNISIAGNPLPVSMISGLRNSPRLIGYSKATAALLVIFTEGGAAAFLKQPLHELFQGSLSLDDLIPRFRLNEVEERLGEAGNTQQRIAIVERFLLSILKVQQSDLLITNAIQEIKQANGDLRIKSLISKLYISQDAFEKRFRKTVGTSPKQFAGIVRWRNVIAKYPQSTSLTAAAHAAGYFDQAHFIKDFKSFTGQTPHSFFTSPVFW